MASVQAHYDHHLGPVYAWMAGGIEPALARGAAELEAIAQGPGAGDLAVDLGAGFGMHALPLARLGYEVVAIDACGQLLEELRARAGEWPITVVEDDLLRFRAHLDRQPRLVACMGDTITHLPDADAVRRLVADVADALEAGGCFVVTFRDHSVALTEERRFIPVRSDARRILTCFLEFGEAHVTVHDILQEWRGGEWTTRVSSYPKLRLAPDWLEGELRGRGLSVERSAGGGGMVRLVARRPRASRAER